MSHVKNCQVRDGTPSYFSGLLCLIKQIKCMSDEDLLNYYMIASKDVRLSNGKDDTAVFLCYNSQRELKRRKVFGDGRLHAGTT